MLKGSLATLALIALSIGLAAPAGAASTPERLVFDGNVLWHNTQDNITDLPWSATSGPCTLATAFTYTTQDLGTVFFTHNRTDIDPKLVDPYNPTAPRWDPQINSPLRSKYAGDAVVLDAHSLDPSFFEQTNYVGAVDYRLADPTRDWTTGWTYFNHSGGLGRTDINYSKPVVILTGLQTTNLHLVNTNNYLLRGKVEMVATTTLTIDAGTYLFGEKATTGYLTIDRGAKIMAIGTVSQPIVITSDQDPTTGSMVRGDNGGIVIHGRAIANCANTVGGDSCVSEGGAGFFGGGDDSDNSGKIRYMRVEYAGKEISPDNELNSWTMNALGTGTDFEYLEASQGFDDMFEWFGGAIKMKHLVGVDGGDDGLDWQLGYRGEVQFAVIQEGSLGESGGIEADNSEFNFSAPYRSNPLMSNLTLVGTNPPTPGQGSINSGVQWRRGTAGTVINSVILGFRGPGLWMTDPETFANCPGTAPAVFHNPTITGVDAQQNMPSKIYMAASPNPFNASTNILFGLPKDERSVRAQVFDARGRLVDTLAEGPMNSGNHAIRWAPKRDIPAGTYFFRVQSEEGLSTSGKLIVVR